MTSGLDAIRAAIEGAVSTALASYTIAWPSRPVTVPATGVWVRPDILWADSALQTCGATGVAQVETRGILQVTVFGRNLQGMGAVYAAADAIRTAFTLRTPTGVQFEAASPPVGVRGTDPAFVQVAVSVPFVVDEVG